MRKSCAKLVDALPGIVEAEHHLYSIPGANRTNHVANPQAFPTKTHIFSKILPTAFFQQINLLVSKFSTVYTGLITSITKYTFTFNFLIVSKGSA